MTDRTYSRIISCVFVLNAVFLIWAILWKCSAPFVGDGSQRMINLIPFNGNTGWEMQFNILLFIPFGFLLPGIMKKGFLRQVLLVVFASLLMEITQYILAVGRSDLTDLLLNTLGGIVGIIAYYLMARLFGKHQRFVFVVACAFIALLELYMSVSFILFGLVWFGFIMFKL